MDARFLTVVKVFLACDIYRCTAQDTNNDIERDSDLHMRTDRNFFSNPLNYQEEIREMFCRHTHTHTSLLHYHIRMCS